MSIELHNVSKQFGGVAAVNNVSFSVREGELMALLARHHGEAAALEKLEGLFR